MTLSDTGSEQPGKTNRELRIVMDAAPIGIVVFNESKRIIYANPMAEALFTTKLVRPAKVKCGDFIACANRHAHPRGCGHTAACPACSLFGAIQAVLSGDAQPSLQEGETLLQRGPGLAPIWIKFKAGPILLDGRKGVVMALDDISLHKQMEGRLRESERKFRFLTEKMTDIVWTMDRDFRTTYASPSLQNVLGFTLEERKQQTLEEMIAPESLERVRAMYLEELQADEKGAPEADRSATIEIEYYRKDGSTLWMENVVKWLRDPDGAIVGIYGVSRDISERRLAEERREKLEAQLRQSQKMESVGRLAGGVAHDFNNMLGVILGHAELVMEAVDPAQPIYNDLHEIWKAARRSAELTRQLLTFARKQTVRPQVLDLNDTVSGMLRMLQRIIGENITLIWRPGADLWPVRIDPIQIDQILANLAVNARDAIVLPAGPDKLPKRASRQAGGTGTLTIATENMLFDAADCTVHNGYTPGRYVRLTVGDDGCGMSQEALENLFEPFFTTKEVGKGTGLGLATIYGIVKQNNGFINVYSEPEKGTTVKINFPAETAVAAAKPDTVETEPGRGAETILLVEDESEILKLSKIILERYGYSVFATARPEAALTLAQQHPGPIHLLITDVVMPVMNGKELKDRIMALRPEIKVLFMSGYTADAIAHHGMLEKGVPCLQKPFSVKAFASRVRKVLDEG